MASNFSILRLVSEYEEELFPDALDPDFDTGCRTAPQESVSDIKENRLNNDGPIDPGDDNHASYTGSEAESEDSEFISCPM